MVFKQTSSICRTHAVRGIGLAVVAGLAMAQSAWCSTFAWNANSESDIAGYKLYYGSSSGSYSQSVSVGKVTQATVSTLTPGAKYYAAVAAFNSSGVEGAKSAEVSFTASGTVTNPTPSVSITSPTSGATYVAPATVSLAAQASVSGGTISYVEFYNGSTRVVTVTSAPYTFSLGSLAAGSYTFTARAYDALGTSATSSPVTVTVTASQTTTNQPPTCSMTSPSNGATFAAPANLTATVAASDSDGTISKVELYNGSALLATLTSSPYTVTFTGIPAGTYTVKAIAYDDKGASTSSAPVTLTVGTVTPPVNQAPTVSVTSPSNGANFTAPASVVVSASAADADGSVSKVEFYNGTTLVGSDTASPYTFTYSNLAAGSYSLKAVAYDDKGASTTSTPVSVTVNATAPVNQAPTVSLTSPANGGSFTAPASVVMNATAADTDGSISKVEFYNGTTLVGTDTASPYTFTYSNLAAGSYSLKAVAYDNTGATATSTTANITVAAAANKAPTVTLTSPVNGAKYKAPASATLTATASDSDGTISKVEFYNGSTLVATDTTAPYTANFSGIPVGTYYLTVKAFDNKGATATSARTTVTVTRY